MTGSVFDNLGKLEPLCCPQAISALIIFFVVKSEQSQGGIGGYYAPNETGQAGILLCPKHCSYVMINFCLWMLQVAWRIRRCFSYNAELHQKCIIIPPLFNYITRCVYDCCFTFMYFQMWNECALCRFQHLNQLYLAAMHSLLLQFCFDRATKPQLWWRHE